MEESLLNSSFILVIKSFGINTDVFETNLINQLIILGALIKLGGDTLKQNLSERNQKIINEMEDALSKLSDALVQYTKVKTDVQQARIYCNSIRKENLETKALVLKLTHETQRVEYKKMLNVTAKTLLIEKASILEDLKIWCGQFAFGLILKYLDTIPSYVRNDYFRIWEYYNFIKLLEELKTQNKK